MKNFRLLSIALCAILLLGCNEQKQTSYLDYTQRLADSQMLHNPSLWQTDGVKAPKWDYTQGLMARAMLAAYRETGNEVYMQYVQEFADYFIQPDGAILTYKKKDYNIDRVNGGTFLFAMNDLQPEPRFAAAIDSLYSQLLTHPRTSEGGFWHKKIYPYQMWLDGIYMAEPFYCRYAKDHHLTDAFDDIQNQFETIDRHTYDSVSGLNFHGWDESREQLWADSITGCSPHFWGRSMGWYLMAMADVLDNMPSEHPGYTSILKLFQRSSENILRWQDQETHLWYQVLDHPGDEGNYLEATCSAMFCYAFAKGANQGYLPQEYKHEAELVFQGIADHLLIEQTDTIDGQAVQSLSLSQCCAVAGLGGKPYRSGSYEYYVNEKIINDDPKGVGPLILATIELAR